MQAVKRPHAFLAPNDAQPPHQHCSREYSSRAVGDRRMRQHVTAQHFAHDQLQDQAMDMEDMDIEEHATAVGALLALQTATHTSQLPMPARRAAHWSKLETAEHAKQLRAASPSLAAAATAAAAEPTREAAFGPMSMKQENMGASHMEAAHHREHQDLDRRDLHKCGSQEPQTSNNNANSGSSGSAKDTFVGASQDLEALEDMEVTIVSATEKGCQVWLPPLPEEIERLQKCMRNSQRKRKLPALQRDVAGAAEDGDVGTCSTVNDDDVEQGAAGQVSDLCAPRDNTEGGLNKVSDKRQRFIWTNELHERFVAAVQHLGVKTAVPKAILQIMKVDGMTRENVASHLQKFRMALRRMEMQAGNTGSHLTKCLSQEDMALLSHTHRFGCGGLPGPSGNEQEPAARREPGAHSVVALDEATNSLKPRHATRYDADYEPCHDSGAAAAHPLERKASPEPARDADERVQNGADSLPPAEAHTAASPSISAAAQPVCALLPGGVFADAAAMRPAQPGLHIIAGPGMFQGVKQPGRVLQMLSRQMGEASGSGGGGGGSSFQIPLRYSLHPQATVHFGSFNGAQLSLLASGLEHPAQLQSMAGLEMRAKIAAAQQDET